MLIVKLIENLLKFIYKIVKIIIFFFTLVIIVLFGWIFIILFYGALKLFITSNNTKQIQKMQKIAYYCFRYFIKIFLETFLSDYKVWGKENLKYNGPKIYCSNHFSSSDPFFAYMTLKGHIHMVLGPMYTIKALRPLLKLIQQIDASEANRKNTVNEAVKYLKNGESIYIFPEGDLNDQETFLKFYQGVAKIHLESGAPIVPIGMISPKRDVKEIKFLKIKTSEKMWKMLSVLSGKYYINIGQEMTFDKSFTPEEITNKVKEAITELIGDLKVNKFWS